MSTCHVTQIIKRPREGPILPRIGLGTYTLRGDDCKQAVKNALVLGYRLIDTASVYQNEEFVGDAIVESGIARDEIFLTTKANPKQMRLGREGIIAALDASLAKLKTDYVDLYLLHWPGIAGVPTDSDLHVPKRIECWNTMVELQHSGKCRRVGVSNFLPRHLQSILSTASGSVSLPPCVPFVNQIELHPLCLQDETVKICRELGVLLQQYSPLAQGSDALISHPALMELFRSHFDGKPLPIAPKGDDAIGCHENAWSIHDVCLLWGWIAGYDSMVVRSRSVAHLERNIRLLRIVEEGLLTSDQVDGIRHLSMAMHNSTPKDVHVCWHSDLIR